MIGGRGREKEGVVLGIGLTRALWDRNGGVIWH